MNNMNNTNSINTKNIITPNLNAIHSFMKEQEVNNWLTLFDKFEITDEGVITLKASEQALKCEETRSLAVSLLWTDSFDSMLVGEDGCAGNFDMYTPIYLMVFNCEYLVLYSKSEAFARGEEVTLYPRETTKEELEEDLEWAYNH